jgi:hypothetical protein
MKPADTSKSREDELKDKIEKQLDDTKMELPIRLEGWEKNLINKGIAEGRRLQKIEDAEVGAVFENGLVVINPDIYIKDIEKREKQGYAKALADVEKIVIKMMVEDNFVLIDGEELRSSLKELGK